jgi:hypothetical protein
MQVFLKNGALVDMTSNIPVIAFYPDNTVLVGNMHANTFVMYAPDNAIIKTGSGTDQPVVIMTQNWRSDSTQSAAVIDYEANRRIDIAFPTSEQTKANAITNNNIMTYGHDSTTWPSNAQSQKVTITGGFNYINDVEAAATTMKGAAPPLDPTDNSHWPAPITPIHL